MKTPSYKEDRYNQKNGCFSISCFPLSERGLTLVELLIVVTIIAVLAGIAIPIYGKFIERSRISVAMAEADSIRKAILILETDTDLWPGAKPSDDCKAEGKEYADLTANNIGLFNNSPLFIRWKGPYLGPSHLDSSGDLTDPWGMSYFLDCDYKINEVDYVVVGSFGPNKIGMNNYDSDNVYVVIGDR